MRQADRDDGPGVLAARVYVHYITLRIYTRLRNKVSEIKLYTRVSVSAYRGDGGGVGTRGGRGGGGGGC